MTELKISLQGPDSRACTLPVLLLSVTETQQEAELHTEELKEPTVLHVDVFFFITSGRQKLALASL